MCNEKEENLKSWICEHCCDYEQYAKVLWMCGYSLGEIARDLEGCADEEEIDDIMMVLAEVE